MPIWYDPATRQPYLFESSASGFKRLVGSNNFTISFQRRIPPVGFGKTAVRGSQWWYPQQQILFVLDRIEDTYLVGTMHQGGFTLRMPISKATFLLEYRFVPLMVGTYWTLQGAPTELLNETIYITAVRSLSVYYHVPKERHVSNQFIIQRPPRRPEQPRMHLLDLLRQGYQRELPAPGDIWVDLHGEDVRVIQTTEHEVTYRNLAGGEGICPMHHFFYLFRRPSAPIVTEESEPGTGPEAPTAWDRIS
jgi:hypothetical protein